MQTMGLVCVRSIVALLISFKAFDDLFATALTISYQMGALGVAERLGRLTPGDDYRRLVPLMDAVPVWLHGLWVLAAILYLTALVRFVRRKGAAHVPVLAAVGIEVVATLVGRPIVAATGVVVNPNPSAIATVVIPFILPLFLALVLWQTGRQTSASMAGSR